jgi:hypothetical protein
MALSIYNGHNLAYPGVVPATGIHDYASIELFAG